VKKVPGWV